ncbi:MAG TPA: ketopantoate reductase family protein [Candidatus Thermoplasmatota archaeon]|nr:ketopantoate reductase family protein [Candidatus Thermoplasmatota archaeon]
MDPPPRVLVVGPGAIGTLVAARLQAAGTPVTLACRSPEAARFLSGKGLEATGAEGVRLRAHVPAVSDPAEVRAPAPMLVLATKCADAAPALRHWLAAASPEAPVVAMQNGVLGDELAALVPGRLVECTVSFPATLTAPGCSLQTGPGHLILGAWPGGRGPVAQRVSEAASRLAPAAPVRTSLNMAGTKWSKLLVNSCISTLGVAAGTELGPLMESPRARRAFLRVVEEGYRAGRAAGIRFEPVAGFRPALFASPVPGRQLLLRALGRRQARHRSSSLQSLERGQRTEVDFLNGHIVATARRLGIAAPVNEALVDLVHAIEEGRLHPDITNLDGLPT